jgi:hypothetical protein
MGTACLVLYGITGLVRRRKLTELVTLGKMLGLA